MRALAALLLGWLTACAGPGGGPVTVSDGRHVMGTVLDVTLVASSEREGREALVELFAVAERLDAQLSVYDAASELSRLNRAAGRGPQPIGPELARVLRLAGEYSRLTRGSFDVTVGPLIDLWTEAAERDAAPRDAEIVGARARVGARYVKLAEGTAELTKRGVRVDLGGVAKGYALDRMRPLLERRGIANALLNFGQSSTWAIGRPQEGEAWRLLARGPGESFLGVLNLEDRALSVSGSLGQWVEIGGRRFGHVIDPRSGAALTHRRQALVVARDATLAEALSKAVLVLGEREGLALVDAQEGCEALLVDADGGIWRTPGWNAATGFAPLDN